MLQRIRLTENQLRNIVTEAVSMILCEANAIDGVQSLIQQANEAYKNAYEAQGGDNMPLMDKEGNSYGLTSEIYIDGRGFIVFPFAKQAYGEHNGVEKIKVFQKKGGKTILFQGDFYDEGWKDARKLLKQIIRDAEIGAGYFKEFNPDWEMAQTSDERKANVASIRNMNKRIGRKSSTGIEYA